MRAKTKKDLIIQAVIAVLIIYVLFLWHPDTQYRVVIKAVVTVLGTMLYGVIDKLWKWKEADEDEKPLWWEKSWYERRKERQTETKQQDVMDGIQPIQEEVHNEVMPEETETRSGNGNLWIYVSLLAIAALFVYLILRNYLS